MRKARKTLNEYSLSGPGEFCQERTAWTWSLILNVPVDPLWEFVTKRDVDSLEIKMSQFSKWWEQYILKTTHKKSLILIFGKKKKRIIVDGMWMQENGEI
jgi:hypothetical protein